MLFEPQLPPHQQTQSSPQTSDFTFFPIHSPFSTIHAPLKSFDLSIIIKQTMADQVSGNRGLSSAKGKGKAVEQTSDIEMHDDDMDLDEEDEEDDDFVRNPTPHHLLYTYYQYTSLTTNFFFI
jgi:hypothetical protein